MYLCVATPFDLIGLLGALGDLLSLRGVSHEKNGTDDTDREDSNVACVENLTSVHDLPSHLPR